MLGTVLDKVTGLVGRAFVISAFSPILLFAVANLPPLILLYGAAHLLDRWKAMAELQTVASVGFFLLALAASYLLMTVSPVLKRILEGAYSIGKTADWLKVLSRRRFLERQRQSQDEAKNLGLARLKVAEWARLLIASHNDRASRELPPPKDKPLLAGANKLVSGLVEDFARTGEIQMTEAEVAVRAVRALYDANYSLADVEPLQERLLRLGEELVNAMEGRYGQALTDFQSRYASTEGAAGVKPTPLGNIMAAAWSYPYTRYGLDATLAWPRLQKVIPADYFRVVEDARITYDFSVSMLFLSFLYSYFWLLVFVWTRGWPALWIPVLGFMACAFSHSAAIEAGRAFGEVFRSCFDLFRFSLLEQLRLTLPSDLWEERKKWNNLNQILIFGDNRQNLQYAQPSEPAPSTSPASTSGLPTKELPHMEFVLSHSPDVINHRIDVTVKAAGGQVIISASTKLDGGVLATDSVDPPSVQYERHFRQVGIRSPGLKHTLVVTARDQSGKEESATKIWEDTN